MFGMDLNSKGITWVGNIYQKFEAMCLEVEDIVCQDTVKYVESQVQTVGENVKKFYAEVVQDLLPPVSEDLSKEAETDISVEKNADIGIHEQSKVAVEKDDLKEKPVVHKERKLNAVLRKSSSRGPRNTKHMLAPSVNTGKERKLEMRSEQKSVDMYRRPKTNTEGDYPRVEKQMETRASPLSSRLNKSHLRSPSLVGCSKGAGVDFYQEGNIVVGRRNAELKIGKDRFDEKLPSPEASEVIASAEKDKVRQELIISEPPTSAELIGCNTLLKAGSDHNDALSANATDNSSMPPSSDMDLPVVLSEIKAAEIKESLSRSILSTGSNDKGISHNDGAVSGMHNECPELKASPPLSEIGKYGIPVDEQEKLDSGRDAVEPEIEMIKECDNVKLGDSCIVVDSKELHFLCRKEVKSRSYKKKIRDAFASRKGSAAAAKKDYEQLAVWCEDLDARTNQQGAQCSTLSTHNSGEESDWELL